MGAKAGVLVIVCMAIVGCSAERLTAEKDDTYYPITADSAGEYLTVGPRDGDECTWARASKPSGDWADFLDTGKAPANRNTTVTLRDGDYFISWGCNPWRRQ